VSDARALIDEDEDIFRLVGDEDNDTICSAHALKGDPHQRNATTETALDQWTTIMV